MRWLNNSHHLQQLASSETIDVATLDITCNNWYHLKQLTLRHLTSFETIGIIWNNRRCDTWHHLQQLVSSETIDVATLDIICNNWHLIWLLCWFIWNEGCLACIGAASFNDCEASTEFWWNRGTGYKHICLCSDTQVGSTLLASCSVRW